MQLCCRFRRAIKKKMVICIRRLHLLLQCQQKDVCFRVWKTIILCIPSVRKGPSKNYVPPKGSWGHERCECGMEGGRVGFRHNCITVSVF